MSEDNIKLTEEYIDIIVAEHDDENIVKWGYDVLPDTITWMDTCFSSF